MSMPVVAEVRFSANWTYRSIVTLPSAGSVLRMTTLIGRLNAYGPNTILTAAGYSSKGYITRPEGTFG